MLKLRPEQWQALSPHLDQMLGMREEERSIWLSSLRERNPMLVRQLESLLHEHHALVDDGLGIAVASLDGLDRDGDDECDEQAHDEQDPWSRGSEA